MRLQGVQVRTNGQLLLKSLLDLVDRDKKVRMADNPGCEAVQKSALEVGNFGAKSEVERDDLDWRRGLPRAV